MSSKRKTQIQIEEKKHKKFHKHHKKRHKRQDNESDDELNESSNIMSDKCETPIKLTIKIGGQTLGEKSVVKSSIRALNSVNLDNESNDEELESLSINFDEEDNEEMDEEIGTNDNEEPDEEEVWLDALQEGRLHEVDEELKKIRDPKLMTARQRALLENKSLKRKSDAVKLKASQSQDSNTIMSEEMIERKLLNDRKRRQQAEEKKEKDKKQTIDRLLRKRQELAKAKKKKRNQTPYITYKNNQNGIFICVPNGIPFQMMSSKIVANCRPLTPVKCARNGCHNNKKYSCSKTNLPVCSIDCYKLVNK